LRLRIQFGAWENQIGPSARTRQREKSGRLEARGCREDGKPQGNSRYRRRRQELSRGIGENLREHSLSRRRQVATKLDARLEVGARERALQGIVVRTFRCCSQKC